jgi:hypothetical protein
MPSDNLRSTLPTSLVILDENDLVEMGVASNVNTIRGWRAQGRGPRFVRLGRLVKYRLSDVEEFLNSLPTGGGGPMDAQRHPMPRNQAVVGLGGEL